MTAGHLILSHSLIKERYVRRFDRKAGSVFGTMGG